MINMTMAQQRICMHIHSIQKRTSEIKEIKDQLSNRGSQRDTRVIEGIDTIKEVTLSCEKMVKV